MSHESTIFDIKGFVFSHKDEGKEMSLDIALGEEEWEAELDENDWDWIATVRAAIKALPGGEDIYVLPSCQVTGTGPFAIGWSEDTFKQATKKNLDALSKILTDAGYKVEERVERNRFASYG